eukprot:2080713-Rhodomonas_salina.1
MHDVGHEHRTPRAQAGSGPHLWLLPIPQRCRPGPDADLALGLLLLLDKPASTTLLLDGDPHVDAHCLGERQAASADARAINEDHDTMLGKPVAVPEHISRRRPRLRGAHDGVELRRLRSQDDTAQRGAVALEPGLLHPLARQGHGEVWPGGGLSFVSFNGLRLRWHRPGANRGRE